MALNLLNEIRAQTAAEHKKLEAALDLIRRVRTRDDYAHLLRRFRAFYARAEPSLAPHPEWTTFAFGFEERRKLAWLDRDLAALGQSPAEIAPYPAELFPVVDTFARALGAMYVLEGSTLGGQMLAKHFSSLLGVAPERGLAFYAGYGAATGPRWKTFTAALGAYGEKHPDTAYDTAQAAVETFRAIGDCLEGRGVKG